MNPMNYILLPNSSIIAEKIINKIMKAKIKKLFKGQQLFLIARKVSVFFVASAIILSLVQPIFVWANPDPVIIFSDSFDQGGSNLTNGWKSLAGSPDRKGDQAVDGKALHLDNGESAQRHISTQGYGQLDVSYNLKIINFESNDLFTAEYYLDDSLVATTMFNADQNEIKTLVIDNPDRHTKLTLRFTSSANHSAEDVGIDNLTVKGDGLPLLYFYDGFESGSFVDGDWVSGGDINIIHGDIDYKDSDLNNTKIWTDDNSTNVGHDTGDHKTKAHGAELRGNNNSTPGDGVLIKAQDTSGYKNIKVRYSRRVDDLESGDNFKSYYSTDGGISWTELETLDDDNDKENMISVLFGPLDGASDNANFRIKFELNGNHDSDKVFIDDVLIWGDVLTPTTGSITIYKEVVAPDGETNVSDNHEFIVKLNGANDMNLSENSSVAYSDLEPGTYTITEDVDGDYDFVSFSIDNDSNESNGAQVTVTAGQVTEITITNKQKVGTLIVIKNVINNLGGSAVAGDFTINITGVDNVWPSSSFPGAESPGTTVTFNPGSYTIAETGPPGYSQSFNGDCAGVMPSNGIKTCTITNSEIPEGQAALTVIKIVVNDNGGDKNVSDFTLYVDGDEVESGKVNFLEPGDYGVSEDGPDGYNSIFSGDCDPEGDITLEAGTAYTCTITNNDIAPTITFIKKVINDNGGNADVDDFGLTIGGVAVDSGETLEVMANTPIAIGEAGLEGYEFVEITGDGCPEGLGETVTLDLEEDLVCTITNNDIPPVLTLIKKVVGGEAVPEDWELTADGPTQFSGAGSVSSSESFIAGTYILSESEGPANYTSLGWSCAGDAENEGDQIEIGVGQKVTCTITNVFGVSISGVKFNDVFGTGSFDEGDEGIANWWIALVRVEEEENEHQIEIQTELVELQLTGSSPLGGFNFEGVTEGNYKIFEQKCDGWVNTAPGNSFSDSFFDLFYEIDFPGCGKEQQDPIAPTQAQFDSFFDIVVKPNGDVLIKNGSSIEFGNHQLLIIGKEASSEVGEDFVLITWTTDRPGTSRVVYGTESVSNASSTEAGAPNYGYPNSTDIFDQDPKVTDHSVLITGLLPGNTYFYRVISSASPESVGGEQSFATDSSPPPSGGSFPGGSIIFSLAPSGGPTTSFPPIAFTQSLPFPGVEGAIEEVPAAIEESPGEGQVEGAVITSEEETTQLGQTLAGGGLLATIGALPFTSKLLLFIVLALLLILLILWLTKKKKKEKPFSQKGA